MGVLDKLTRADKIVLVLSALTLLLGLANLGRAILAAQYSVYLPDLPTTLSFRYLAVMGGLWGVAFAICTVGLALFREWGRRCTLVVVTLYQIHAWANRILFATSEYVRQTLARDVILTVTLLLVFWIPLNLDRVKETLSKGAEEGR